MSDNNNEFGAFLAGFVIGGLVGAATALILAPQSGRETRSQLVDKGNELSRAGGERVRHYRDVANAYTHDYRDRAGEIASQVEDQARIVLDAGKEQAQQVQEQLAPEDESSTAPDTESSSTGESPAAT